MESKKAMVTHKFSLCFTPILHVKVPHRQTDRQTCSLTITQDLIYVLWITFSNLPLTLSLTTLYHNPSLHTESKGFFVIHLKRSTIIHHVSKYNYVVQSGIFLPKSFLCFIDYVFNVRIKFETLVQYGGKQTTLPYIQLSYSFPCSYWLHGICDVSFVFMYILYNGTIIYICPNRPLQWE